MFKEKVDNFKNSLIKTNKKDNKRSIENLVVLAILLIATIIAKLYLER